MELSDLAKVQITLIVEQLLDEPNLSQRNVVNVVAKKTGVLPAAITSPSRNRQVTTARHIAAYVLMRRFVMSSVQTGAYLERDHASILHAYEQISEYVAYVHDHPELREQYAQPKAALHIEQRPLFHSRIRTLPEGTDTALCALFETQKDQSAIPPNARLMLFGPEYGHLTGPCVLMDNAGTAYFPTGEGRLSGLRRIKNPGQIRAIVDLETRTISFDLSDNLEELAK